MNNMETVKIEGFGKLNVYHWTAPLPKLELNRAEKIIRDIIAELAWWDRPEDEDIPYMVREIAELLTVNNYDRVVRYARFMAGLVDA